MVGLLLMEAGTPNEALYRYEERGSSVHEAMAKQLAPPADPQAWDPFNWSKIDAARYPWMLELARRCLRYRESDRPSSADIVAYLEQELANMTGTTVDAVRAEFEGRLREEARPADDHAASSARRQRYQEDRLYRAADLVLSAEEEKYLQDDDEHLILGSPPLLEYRRVLVSTLSNAVVGCKAVASDKVALRADTVDAAISAAKQGGKLAEVVPVVGALLSFVVSSGLELASVLNEHQKDERAKRLAECFPTVTASDKLFEELGTWNAVRLQRSLVAMHGQVVSASFWRRLRLVQELPFVSEQESQIAALATAHAAAVLDSVMRGVDVTHAMSYRERLSALQQLLERHDPVSK